MSATLVSVDAGQIHVRPSFADLLLVQRLGGQFSGAARAWLLPATEANARLLTTKLRTMRATPEFDSLITGTKAVEATGSAAAGNCQETLPAAVPVPEISIPEGMLTHPWRHQEAAFKFCLDHFAAGFRGILLACGMGTGKSLIACLLVLALLARRVLICCPLRVVPVWITQFERHVGIPVVLVPLDEDAGSVAKKTELAAAKMKLAQARDVPFIAVINYDSAWRDPFAAWAEKANWDLVIADECMPADTMIATPGGSAPIQSLQTGDVILGVDECGRITESPVTATFRRFSPRPLVQIDALVATDNHPVFVHGRGYIRAAAVRTGDWVRTYEDNHDHLRVVRKVIHEDNQRWPEVPLLRQGVLGAVEDVPPRVCCEDPCEVRPGQDGRTNETQSAQPGIRQKASCLPAFRPESVSRSGDEGEGSGGFARQGLPDVKRRQWDGADAATEDASGTFGVGDGVHRPDEDAPRLWLPGALQAGRCEPTGHVRRGGGWAEPPVEIPDRAGCEEGRTPGMSRLDDSAGEQQRGVAGLRGRGAAHLVFNLETLTGNYFANGILVHNCHRLKSPGGKASLFFKRLRLRATHRIALTGTPMPHGPMDIYAVVPVPGRHASSGPSFTPFRQKYAVMGGYQRKQITGFQNLDELER